MHIGPCERIKPNKEKMSSEQGASRTPSMWENERTTRANSRGRLNVVWLVEKYLPINTHHVQSFKKDNQSNTRNNFTYKCYWRFII